MPTVRLAKLDKNCEGCRAAKRALEGFSEVTAKAVSKVQKQHRLIKKLEERVSHEDECKIYKKYPLFQFGKSPDDAECTCGLDELLTGGANDS